MELSTGESFSSKGSDPESCEDLTNSLVSDEIFLANNLAVVGEEVGDGLWVRRETSGSFDEPN